MIEFLYLVFLLIALVIIIALGWRFASRRYTIPCPVWMKGLLDPPFSRGISARTHLTIQRLGLKSDMNVLDAGCGREGLPCLWLTLQVPWARLSLSIFRPECFP